MCYAEASTRKVRDTPVFLMRETPVYPSVGEVRESVQQVVICSLFGAFGPIVLPLLAMDRASRDRATVELFRLVGYLLARVSKWSYAS
jgi:hypothetical protein